MQFAHEFIHARRSCDSTLSFPNRPSPAQHSLQYYSLSHGRAFQYTSIANRVPSFRAVLECANYCSDIIY